MGEQMWKKQTFHVGLTLSLCDPWLGIVPRLFPPALERARGGTNVEEEKNHMAYIIVDTLLASLCIVPCIVALHEVWYPKVIGRDGWEWGAT